MWQKDEMEVGGSDNTILNERHVAQETTDAENEGQTEKRQT